MTDKSNWLPSSRSALADADTGVPSKEMYGWMRHINGIAGTGSGGVSSVNVTGGTTGLTTTGGPIVDAGAIVLDGVLATSHGGTGLNALGVPGQALTVNASQTGLVYSTFAVGGVNDQTASYSLVQSDAAKLVTVTTGGPSTVTIPPSSSQAFGLDTQTRVLQKGAGQVQIIPGPGVTLLASIFNTNYIRSQNDQIRLTKIAAPDTWVIDGDTGPLASAGVLLHYDETVFIDQRGHTLSASIYPTQDTVTRKFGPSSALYGAGARLLVTPLFGGDLDITASGTIEGWVYIPSLGTRIIYDSRGNGSGGTYSIVLYINSSGFATIYNFPVAATSTNAMLATTWTHFALTRDSTSGHCYLCLNGIVTDLGVSPMPANDAGGFVLGGDNSGNYLNGNMDEFRLDVKVCHYSGSTGSTYTIPSGPFA